MMMVLTLILIAASISQPIYQNMMLRAREAALRDTLYTMRSLIDRFTLDNKRPPESLHETGEERGSASIRLAARSSEKRTSRLSGLAIGSPRVGGPWADGLHHTSIRSRSDRDHDGLF
jgi:type II secretory pathway pseudopilin PulG